MKAVSHATSTPIFSMVFGVVYLTCFYMDWAPFRYYPDAGVFHVHAHPEAGPAILWYGWVATAAVLSLLVARAVPRSWAARLTPRWAWLIPVLTVVAILIYERRWFV